MLFPGENWFFFTGKPPSRYGAVSCRPTQDQIKFFVPINWAFHWTLDESVDFGHHKPETNLAKLAEIAGDLSKEITFLLPITPAPFFTKRWFYHISYLKLPP